MKTVGAGVSEIRIREASGAYRVIFLASRPEAIYVLHCFQKKTERTSQRDIDLAKARFKAVPKPPRK
jgi:phage-related protein